MTAMSNDRTAAEFFELMNRRALDHMGELVKEETRLLFPKTRPLVGRDRIIKFFQILFRQYPELQFDIQRIITQGDRVAVHWTNVGITRKKEPYQNEGVTLFEFENGKIVFISDFFKDTAKF
jgi:ketosteroid isomerase-like protein